METALRHAVILSWRKVEIKNSFLSTAVWHQWVYE